MVQEVIERAEKYAHSRLKCNKNPVSKRRKKAETYVPVKPCKYGHRERYVKGHQNCVKCTKAKNKRRKELERAKKQNSMQGG